MADSISHFQLQKKMWNLDKMQRKQEETKDNFSQEQPLNISSSLWENNKHGIYCTYYIMQAWKGMFPLEMEQRHS